MVSARRERSPYDESSSDVDHVMTTEELRCALLADQHLGLAEAVLGLLKTTFDAVVIVADEISLRESARRLQLSLAIVDLSLTKNNGPGLIQRIRGLFPELKLIVLSVHPEMSVQQAVIAAGANGFVLKQSIATDLLPAVDSVLAGNRYLPDPNAS